MATGRFLICDQCGPSLAGGTLFDVLLARAHGRPQHCAHCGSPTGLQLKFDFGLNAADSECTVRDCFVPRQLESWNETDESKVTFYPFLVIVQRHGRELAAWLPYWHVVERGKKPAKKYGQWAPFMDLHLFADLLDQARARGYTSEQIVGPGAA
jgi:hypothetical protein